MHHRVLHHRAPQTCTDARAALLLLSHWRCCGCAHTDRCTQAKDLGTADFAETMLGTP
jgi:hypothetical protein